MNLEIPDRFKKKVMVDLKGFWRSVLSVANIRDYRYS
jgi:hypothetical protein